MSKKNSNWVVYLLKCNDNSLYCGITTDINRRIDEHNHDNSKGSKYTRVRRPVTCVYQEICADRSSASQREYAIKRLSKTQKENLIADYQKPTSQ